MATLEEVLSSIDAERKNLPPQANESELVANLVRQNMISGLGAGPNGQLAFHNPGAGTGGEPGSMGAAGYAGPLRPSDAPDWNASADIPVMYGSELSPGTKLGQVMAGGPFRGVLPDEKAQRLSQGLMASNAFPSGAQKEVAEGILRKYGLAEDPTQALLRKLSVTQSFKDKSPMGINDASKLFRYNRETGQLESPPDNVTPEQARDAGFKNLTDKQRSAVSDIAFTKEAFNQFVINKKAADQAAENSSIGGAANVIDDLTQGRFTGGAGMAFNKSRVQLTSAFDGLIGGVRGAASPMLTQIRLKVLPQLLTEKGTSDLLVKQFGELIDTLAEAKVNSALGAPAAGTEKKIMQKAQAILGGSKGEVQSAPQAALDALKANPDKKDEFKAKFGYLPEGY